jgi:hypothetical protein
MILKQANGYERHYLKLTQGGKFAGLALTNIDHSAANEFRGYIRHISVVNFSLLQNSLEAVIDFLWRRVYCQNIRVEIYHIKDEETQQMKVDLDVKNAFAKCGFKWKTLSNDPITGKRA